MQLSRPQPGDKVLWIRFSAFGDVLQAAAAAHRFKMKYPGVRLTFLTKPDYAGILKIQPYVDDLLLWDVKKRPLDFFRVVRQVRAENFRWLFSLHRVGANAAISLCSNISWRFGYNRGTQFCYKTTHWECLDRLDVEFTKRDQAAIFATPEDKNEASAMLSGLPDKKLFTVIGASRVDKLWKTERWIEFLRPLLNQGWGIVLNGHGPIEEAIGKQIESALPSPNLLNLVGALDFRKMLRVAYVCTLALGNDTGPLHLAALSGLPTMGLFSYPTSRIVGLSMPWFRELCAEDWLDGGESEALPLEALPAEVVALEFNAFAEEFLPKAFAWRDKTAADAFIFTESYSGLHNRILEKGA